MYSQFVMNGQKNIKLP